MTPHDQPVVPRTTARSRAVPDATPPPPVAWALERVPGRYGQWRCARYEFGHRVWSGPHEPASYAALRLANEAAVWSAAHAGEPIHGWPGCEPTTGQGGTHPGLALGG